MIALVLIILAGNPGPQWYVEITSPKYPPFKIAGAYSSAQDCADDLSAKIAEWSAKISPKGQPMFGTVTAACKLIAAN